MRSKLWLFLTAIFAFSLLAHEAEAQQYRSRGGYYGNQSYGYQYPRQRQVYRTSSRRQSAARQYAARNQYQHHGAQFRSAMGNFFGFGPIQLGLENLFPAFGAGAIGMAGGGLISTTGCLFDRAIAASILEDRELSHAEAYNCLNAFVPFLGTVLSNHASKIDTCMPSNWNMIHYSPHPNFAVNQDEKLELYLSKYCRDMYPSRARARQAIHRNPVYRTPPPMW